MHAQGSQRERRRLNYSGATANAAAASVTAGAPDETAEEMDLDVADNYPPAR